MRFDVPQIRPCKRAGFELQKGRFYIVKGQERKPETSPFEKHPRHTHDTIRITCLSKHPSSPPTGHEKNLKNKPRNICLLIKIMVYLPTNTFKTTEQQSSTSVILSIHHVSSLHHSSRKEGTPIMEILHFYT